MLEHQNHDTADSGLPEQCSVLVVHELLSLNIDITALSEVRLPREGSLQEYGAGYTLYWSSKPETERLLSGIGIMVRKNITSKLENLPLGHSDHIISMCLPLQNKKHAIHILQKDKFYTDLCNLVQNNPADDKVFILQCQSRQKTGNVYFCFVQSNKSPSQTPSSNRKTAWRLPVCILDLNTGISLITSWCARKTFKMLTRVMPSAECFIDHCLVLCKFNLHFKPKPKRGGTPKEKFQVNKFQSADVKADFQAKLQQWLEDLSCTTDPSSEVLSFKNSNPADLRRCFRALC